MTNTSKRQAVKKAANALKDSLKKCVICPRRCGVDRTRKSRGFCRAGLNPVVYSYAPHHGEEPVLSGRYGSGTIFFSHCNMKCVYCQNYFFSQLDHGEEVSIEKLADMMLALQKMKCHNINLVSPTHYVPQIVQALGIAIDKGLAIPLVYNTGGYDLAHTIKLLDGVIDIYMPDMRYSADAMASRYSDASDYVGHNRAAVKEMFRQTGNLSVDGNGIAEKGLIIRLLGLPEDVSGTKAALKFIKDEISSDTYLSIMSQYYPTFKAYNYNALSRGVTRREYEITVDDAKRLGLNNGWLQEVPLEFDARFLGTNIRPGVEVR